MITATAAFVVIAQYSTIHMHYETAGACRGGFEADKLERSACGWKFKLWEQRIKRTVT